MFNETKKNKFKTGAIVSFFIILITIIVYAICMMFDFGPASIVIALIFSIVTSWSSYYFSDKIVLSINGARLATREENLELSNILDALMVTADLSFKPTLYVIDSNQPNAFATGRNPENAVICVTTGLIEKLDYYEIEAVIAHELAHVKNFDIRLSAVISVMVGFIAIVSDFVIRHVAFGRSSRRSNDNDSNSGVFIFLIGLVFLILTPIIAKIIQLMVSRNREFLADSVAIEFTRNPDALISALQKITDSTDELESANISSESMYISNPFKEKKEFNFQKLFSTHPPVEERIEKLRTIN